MSSPATGVLIMAYGSAPSMDDEAIFSYLRHILQYYRRTDPSEAEFDDLRERYRQTGGSPLYQITENITEGLQLLARACNRVIDWPKAATSDKDITRRVWLPVDFDPARPSGVSATDDELRVARERAVEAADWLTHELQAEPDIWAFSGNGYHLLYRIDLPNTDESTRWVKSIIDTTASRFSDHRVSVDRTVFNAARIWKLYGTLARKGDQVPALGRVHRRAAICTEAFDSDSIRKTQGV